MISQEQLNKWRALAASTTMISAVGEYTPTEFTDLLDEVARLTSQRDEAVSALQALYDAIPTGFGEDRALNEATKQAEKVLGVKQ